MAFIKIGSHLINEDDITAISPPFYGSTEYQIRLRGSEMIKVVPSNDKYCITKYIQNLMPISEEAENDIDFPDSTFVLSQKDSFSVFN